MGTTSNILQINTSTYSRLGCSEDPKDTHILMYCGAGANYRAYYNISGYTLHLFGDTNATSNNHLKLEPKLNTSYNPFIMQGNTFHTTMNSNLNILGNIFAVNLPNVSTFNIIITQSLLLNTRQYYKYDLDIRQYTTFVIVIPYILQRKINLNLHVVY